MYRTISTSVSCEIEKKYRERFCDIFRALSFYRVNFFACASMHFSIVQSHYFFFFFFYSLIP